VTEPKLSVEMVPKSAWGRNLRALLVPADWDTLRRRQYALAGGVCEICGESGKDQGYREALHCHEVWEYDEKTGVQKLVRLIALCPTCHDVKYFGNALGKGPRFVQKAFEQLLRVNGWTKEQGEAHIGACFHEFSVRSGRDWVLDVTWLDRCGVELARNKPRRTRRRKKK